MSDPAIAPSGGRGRAIMDALTPLLVALAAAASPPTNTQPSTPTLKAPARNAIAVASPVRISGVAADSVAAMRLTPPKDSTASRP